MRQHQVKELSMLRLQSPPLPGQQPSTSAGPSWRSAEPSQNQMANPACNQQNNPRRASPNNAQGSPTGMDVDSPVVFR